MENPPLDRQGSVDEQISRSSERPRVACRARGWLCHVHDPYPTATTEARVRATSTPPTLPLQRGENGYARRSLSPPCEGRVRGGGSCLAMHPKRRLGSYGLCLKAALMLVFLVLGMIGIAAGQAPDKAGPPVAKTSVRSAPVPAASPRSAPASPTSEAIDRQPYRIELHLSLDPSARIDLRRRGDLLKEWHALVHRFVGPPWIVTTALKPSPMAAGNLETLEASTCSGFDSSFDKIWLVRVSSVADTSALRFTGREYDTATQRLGPLQEHTSFVFADAPRGLFQFTLDLFSPTALITSQEGGRALLLVRGASVPHASELGRVVSQGRVFVPLRLVNVKGNEVVVRRILFTYLQVESMDGPLARCAIVSALRDPLTQRVSRPNTLAALGIKPGRGAVRLRFVTKADHAPAAGYTLTARAVPDGLPHELGMTDRAGRITLKPGFAQGLVVLRLLAGNSEPMVEFPMMPGETSGERDIAVDPKPLTVAFQVQLDALRDEVVDLVALRARLEKRMEARLQGDDLAGVEEGIKEYALLPPREVFAEQLQKLKDQATHQQAERKTAVLTKNLQAQFNELQALIDRYLDNEALASYTEAVERKKVEKGEKVKAKEREKPRRAVATAVGSPKQAADAPLATPKAATPPAATKPNPKPTPPKSDVPF